MKRLLRIAAIIGTLPNNLQNGAVADATQVMADLNKIVNDVNANAAPLSNTALLNANNNFSAVQSGINATSAANFPTAGQVQGNMTFGSDVGTPNAFAINPTPPIAAYSDGMPFDFFARNMNGGAATLSVSGLSPMSIVNPNLRTLSSAAITKGGAVRVLTDATNSRFVMQSPPVGALLTNSLAGDVSMNNTGQFFTGPTVPQGTVGTWYATGTVTLLDTAGAASFNVKLWDGTTVIASTRINAAASNAYATASLSGFITNPAGNIRISVNDQTSNSGLIIFNGSSSSMDSTLTVQRIS